MLAANSVGRDILRMRSYTTLREILHDKVDLNDSGGSSYELIPKDASVLRRQLSTL